MDPAVDAPEAPGLLSTFPHTTDEFEADERVSFSKLDQKWILEAEDGSEFEYDEALKRWVPTMDEALLEQQREAYAMAGVDENEPAQPQRKRKNVYTNGEDENGRSQSKKAKATKESGPRKNTAIYVTNLPLDTNLEEVQSVFSKCGVIAEEIDGRNRRIKLYGDEQGQLKGDALIVYFRPESVELAVQMLDDTDFRFGEAGPSGKMKVQPADFSYKNQQEAPAKSNMKDKKKIMKKTQKLNNLLADWDDDDPSALLETSSRWDKVVILKHMFTLEELEEDPAAILDIKEDIRGECAKLGDVTNVVLFDLEPAGVASVRFGTEDAAKACVRVMNGRLFAGSQVEAFVATGAEKFKKTSTRKAEFGDDDGGEGGEREAAHAAGAAGGAGGTEEERKRLDQFGTWLESQEQEKEAE
ncbi:MAG: hypothetical protein M1838_002663 [Thelocarpon superellum]|nr:MAG: hypothetical protein M1838_002663 [Thelocarpon superellum]